MQRLFLAPLTPLFELNLALNLLLILAGPVIYAFTLATGEFYKSIL